LNFQKPFTRWWLFLKPNLRHVLNLVILVRDIQHSTQALEASVSHRSVCSISRALACKFSRRICRDSAGRYARIVGFESEEVVKLFQANDGFSSIRSYL
jgi:hypothetical protein